MNTPFQTPNNNLKHKPQTWLLENFGMQEVEEFKLLVALVESATTHWHIKSWLRQHL